MEVCDECIHTLELVAGIDEDIGPSGSCGHGSVRKCRRLNGSAGGGSRADDSVSLGVGLVYLIRLGLLHNIELAVHMVLLDLLSLDRSEGSEPDMQSNVGDLHTLRLHCLQKLFGPMQTCCRCSG